MFMVKPFKLSVSAVILDGQKRCLLLRRSSASQHFSGEWEWPGGKLDAGEDFAAALLRETREETGLDVGITGLAGSSSFELPAVQVVVLALEVRVLGGEILLSDEHDNFAWVPLSEFASRKLHQHLRPLMLAYAQRKGTLS